MATLLAHAPEIGPGWTFNVVGIAGPNPNDDYCVVAVQLVATGASLTNYVGYLLGQSFISGIFGTNGSANFPAKNFPQNLTPPYNGPAAVGAAVQVLWVQNHANGALVATQTFTGYTWDLGGVYVLSSLAAQVQGASNAVLNAVQKKY